ncbi:hypothetical protein GRAQ_00126 [Rahnella aquatilis CIP 78.65 = ATCC 33071]|uniref:Uncharacterized protein n=1 Tax=Rahnella aquatilis (strain ATCC 33071 / DSM 4594 / JCM 1683 / NBRC 105701 / NCIMB 13365 / CIP 78.65) TaxID=745277 RepID=H2IZ65_RAHAC|nr:hypothetical protein [Rahnella aquatilis]AEX50978.1 hypothetical protein Rahaq2_1088 [Rahnella aquatilis CIP 78.65 = ATCC 33071]KFD18575.1 hypothetical protein GRAQ_00126 [Rahnella aquatilis CIP 78.65 = ATCC 33071]
MFFHKKSGIHFIKKEDIKHSSGEKETILNSWRFLPKNLVLVHAFEGEENPFCQHRAESLLNSWDIISTSLVDLKDIKPLTKIKRYTGMYCTTALILDVPVQNILGTHPTDVWFPNHIGRKNDYAAGRIIDASALSRAIFRGEGKDDYHCEGGYQRLLTPQALLSEDKKTRSVESHNEVLIIGRPGVKLYAGLPATQSIRVRKIVVVEQTESNDMYDYYAGSPEIVAAKAAEINKVEYEII